MAKKASKAAAAADEPTSGGGWPLWARALASVAVAWHLFAVFMSPFGVPPTSELVFNVSQSPWVRWYSDPVYINGGYQFFAPDPPLGGTLVRYTVTDTAGGVLAEGEFPNRANDRYGKQWPRLWYHRHMMLADQAADVVAYFDADGLPDREANQRLSLRSYARHLLRKHGGVEARVEYVEHRSLHFDEVFPERPRQLGLTPDGWQPPPALKPTDPSLYRTVLTVTERAGQLDEDLLPARPPAPREQAGELIPIGAGAGRP